MKAIILIEDFVEDVEFIYPYFRLKEEGIKVDVVSTKPGTFRGKKGCSFTAEKGIDEVNSKDYDILFIPGGYAPDRLRRNKAVLDFVSNMANSGKIVSSVCHGPWVLISAGVAKGRNITGFSAIKDDIANSGAHYTGKSVEIDKNIITGTNPDAMPELLKAIIRELRKQTT